MFCVTAAATTATVIILPLSLSFSDLGATMSNPLAVHLNLSLNLNLGTTRAPPNIHLMLSPSQKLIRVDRCEPDLPILRWSMAMIDGVVVSVVWRCRIASISRSPLPVYKCPLTRIPPHEYPWFASRYASAMHKMPRRILRVDGR